jgi:hypothetical protein
LESFVTGVVLAAAVVSVFVVSAAAWDVSEGTPLTAMLESIFFAQPIANRMEANSTSMIMILLSNIAHLMTFIRRLRQVSYLKV